MRLLPSVFLAVLFLAVPSLASAQSGQILDNALRRAEQIQKLKAMDEAREREQERHKAECAARTDAEAQEPTEPPRELPPREELQATIMEMRQRRVQLFNNCEQMSLSVQFMSKDSAIANIEDIEDRIQTMAESRLRAARLFTDSASNNLYVGLTVSGPAFSAYMHYAKPLYDAVSGLTCRSPSWLFQVGSGTHGGNAEGVLHRVSEAIDLFVLEYLRVNDSVCAP